MIVIADYRLPCGQAVELARLGYEVIPTAKLKNVYDEIQGHADIQLHRAGEKLICAPEVYGYYKNRLPDTDIVRGSLSVGSEYPSDIPYNACGFGDTVICRAAHTAPEVLIEYRRVADTRQGYAKCSICVVSETAAITADEGIYKQLLENGFDALKIRPGYVRLGRMGGFIGGASGLLPGGLVAFCGDLMSHPDGAEIAAFCRANGAEAVSLGNGELFDAGSIIAVPA
ncbi:MAG: hypothetical protein IJH37_02380 [Clostridia bacterium]|nr:hypothetical protein [Clostridia bacterium]